MVSAYMKNEDMESDFRETSSVLRTSLGQNTEPTVDLSGLSENDCSSPTPSRRRLPSSSDSSSDLSPEEASRQLDIPQLDGSMTPWRFKQSIQNLGRDIQLPASYLDTSYIERSHTDSNADLLPIHLEATSPLNSRPHTRNSLFSDNYMPGVPTTSASSSNDIEQMQKQLTNYKLRLKVLTEIVRDINLNRDQNSGDVTLRKPMYDQLLHSFSNNDQPEEQARQLNEFQECLKTKNEEISSLKKELDSIKKEYASVLDDVNSYLEQSDRIAGRIDNILTILTDNDNVSVEEKRALIEAQSVSPNFLDVKIDALGTTLKSLMNTYDSSYQLEGSETTTITNNEASVGSISMIDSRLETAIESMHHEYRAFLLTLRGKLENCSKIEDTLGDKLNKQRAILFKINALYKNSQISEMQHSSASAISDDRNDVISSNLAKSYHNHIENLNEVLITYKDALNEKEHELEGIRAQRLEIGKDTIERTDLASTNSVNSKTSEDKTIENQQLDHQMNREGKSSSESQLSAARSEIADLRTKVRSLEDDLVEVQEECENAVMDIEKTLKMAIRKSSSFASENRHLHEQLDQLQYQSQSLADQNNELQRSIESMSKKSSDFKKLESEFRKFKRHLLLHLNNIFDVFDKILQKSSINQAKNKLNNIESADSLLQFKTMHAKLESLYVFIETAVDSIVEEHAKMLLKERERISRGSPNEDADDEQSLKLRIELLERKWTAERERRKLDAEAAETRIAQLEAENEYLQQRLRASGNLLP